MRPTPWKKQSELSREGTGGLTVRRLRDQMDRLFDSFFGASPWSDEGVRDVAGGWAPELELAESEKEFTVRAEMPGLDPADIDVRITGSILTLSGEKKEEMEEKKSGRFHSERRYGAFYRSIELPAGARPEGISAEYDKGVLTLRIPKEEGAGSQRIPVKSGSSKSQSPSDPRKDKP